MLAFFLSNKAIMKVESCFKIGFIQKTHGLKGEVTLSLLPECPDLDQLESVFLQIRDQLVPYFFKKVSVKGVKAYVQLEGVDTPELAASLKGCSIYLPKSMRPALARNEFYGDEIIGFEVLDARAGSLGLVEEVQDFGSTRHLIVRAEAREVMIPVNGPFIKKVNKTAKQLTVELPDGFLEL